MGMIRGSPRWVVVPATHESMEDTPLLKCFLFVVFYCRVIMS